MGEESLGAGTGGVWTAAHARSAGLSPSAVQRRVRAGLWQVLRRGVYTWGGTVPDARTRAWAAVLAAGGPGRARAAGRTAARVWGLPLVDDHDPLLPPQRRQAADDDVLGTAPGRVPGLHVARVRLAPEERLRLHGLPVLSPLRTLVDLTRVLEHDALVCALDDALRRGLVMPEQLLAVVADRVGRPGTARLRSAVAVADGRAESPLETLTRLLLLPVLPGLVPQVRVLDRACRIVARVDLGDEELRFGVEADGAAYHGGGAAWAADRRREQRLAEHGWSLERVTWADVRRDGAQTRQRVAEAARRCARRNG